MESQDASGLEIPENLIATINRLRKLVRFYLDSNYNESALFWADKAATCSNDNPKDVYWLAQSMFRCGEYNRVVFLIKNKNLDKSQPLFQWLAGLCLLKVKNYNEALLVLTGEGDQPASKLSTSVSSLGSCVSTPPVTNNHILEGFTPESLRSAILTLKGWIYEKLDNRDHAAECFKQALKYDVFCFDAFHSLVHHQMLSAAEEKELMSSLPFKSQCGNVSLPPFLYKELLNKYQTTPSSEVGYELNKNSRIFDNLDLKGAQAERLFYICNFEKCFKLTDEILKSDQFHKLTLPIHIGCLVELNKRNVLFRLAHNLVDLAPDQAVSWYAVGCYYFLIENYNRSRRYFSKAVVLERYFGPAWLAYGHSFAKENEHDQAMAAYLSASKLMKGCHLPCLYVGTECGLIHNTALAQKFFAQAHSIAPNDPFVFHEMGTVAFLNGDYNEAYKMFSLALSEVQKSDQILVEKWEPLLNNIGHTLRKQKKYNESLAYHRQALSLSPQNPSTMASIGFVQALQENFVEAIETFHKALSLKPDDSLSLTMLSYLIEQIVHIPPTCHDIKEDED